MSRIRKIILTMSVVLAVTAVQVPASADPAAEATCALQELLSKYGWNSPICL